MRRRPPKVIRLKRKDRQEMHQLLDDGRTEQRVARRCRVLLAMEDPDTLLRK